VRCFDCLSTGELKEREKIHTIIDPAVEKLCTPPAVKLSCHKTRGSWLKIKDGADRCTISEALTQAHQVPNLPRNCSRDCVVRQPQVLYLGPQPDLRGDVPVKVPQAGLEALNLREAVRAAVLGLGEVAGKVIALNVEGFEGRDETEGHGGGPARAVVEGFVRREVDKGADLGGDLPSDVVGFCAGGGAMVSHRQGFAEAKLPPLSHTQTLRLSTVPYL
jgi:hypothetical protein